MQRAEHGPRSSASCTVARIAIKGARLGFAVIALGCHTERTVVLSSNDGSSRVTYSCKTMKPTTILGNSLAVVLDHFSGVVRANHKRGDSVAMLTLLRLLEAEDFQGVERIIVEEKCSHR